MRGFLTGTIVAGFCMVIYFQYTRSDMNFNPENPSGNISNDRHFSGEGSGNQEQMANNTHHGAMVIVEFSHVTKTFFPGTDKAFTAIRDVNFKVDNIPGKGEFVSILGPSGCGKSTILRLIAGLEPHHPPTEGSVKVLGSEIKNPGPDRGMVFQDYTSFDNRTVIDNIVFGLECQNMSKDERYERGCQWIKKIGLDVDKDAYKYPYQLSGGMKQRVAIARTLILKPKIILMDEPFGALDPYTRMQMQDLLVDLWRDVEATVFFVTHSIPEGVYLGDRIYILSASPGTIKKELEVPPPDLPSGEMQRDPRFQEVVNDIREIINKQAHVTNEKC